MKRLAFILSLLALPLMVLAADDVKHVDAKEAAALVAAGKVTVLDVRTEDEFKEGHIKGATNVDFMDDSFVQNLAKVDKTKPVLVHCQAGGRSTKALPKLKQAGFAEIYHLDGGYGDWVKEGHPVEK